MGSRLSKVIAMVMVLGITAMTLGFFAFLVDEVGRNGFEFVVAGLVGVAGFGWLLLRGPVGKAIAAMLEGGAPADDAMLSIRMADIEDRLQEISLETQRMTELEDRLDFAERLLTRHSETTP